MSHITYLEKKVRDWKEREGRCKGKICEFEAELDAELRLQYPQYRYLVELRDKVKKNQMGIVRYCVLNPSTANLAVQSTLSFIEVALADCKKDILAFEESRCGS